MLLGKRPRAPMKRTTSMSEITFDLDSESVPPSSDPRIAHKQVAGFGVQLDQRFLSATVAPRTHRRASADSLETAHFLRVCSLCKRRLIPGRDIYMYRYLLQYFLINIWSLKIFFSQFLIILVGLFDNQELFNITYPTWNNSSLISWDSFFFFW